MPAGFRFDQQSVCAARRFGDYGKPDVSRSRGDFPRSARQVPERSDENACGTGSSSGARFGSFGGDAGGESREADPADTGLPKPDWNIDAAGFKAQAAGIGRPAPGSSRGGSYLCAAECAGGTNSVAEAVGPF